MSPTNWHEEPIAKRHDRSSFDCGVPELNNFLRHHARKSHEKGGAKTFLAIADADNKTFMGFYSLCPASLAFERTPEAVRRGLAKYDVPAFRLARLAVSRQFQGQGLGGQLILSAGRRCLIAATEVGGVALLIDAKDESVARWYSTFGAMPLIDEPLKLIIPLSTIEDALAKSNRR